MKPICQQENKYRFTVAENPRYWIKKRRGGGWRVPNMKPEGKRYMARARRRYGKLLSREDYNE